MIIAFWCVLIGAFMPILFTGIAKFTGPRKLWLKENHSPREFLETVEGVQKRAHYAQLNGFEAFPPFAAGVIIAYLAGAATGIINFLAVAWVLFRLVYGWCYLTDRATLRSIIWAVAALCVVGLFVAPVI